MTTGDAAVWPRDEGELRLRFEDAHFCPEEVPTDEQAHVLLDLLACYDDHGLAPARRPLCWYCPHAKACWASAAHTRRVPTRERPEDGGIILPWVGAGHRQGGVLVLGVNPNIAAEDRTYLLSEHELSWDLYDSSLRQAQRTVGRSTFAYRMARSASLLLSWAEGASIPDPDDPGPLLRALHSTARLQAVKCIPKRARSRPTRTMTRRCPSFLLERELEILRPGLILTLGNVPDGAIAQLPGYTYLEDQSSEYLWRHRIIAGWGQAEVFAIPHPADPRGGWKRGNETLQHVLYDRQLRSRG